MTDHRQADRPIYDPEADLAARFANWGIHESKGVADAHKLAATDFRHNRIWIAPGLAGLERRCTIAHEIVHIAVGHDYVPAPWVDDAVELIAADRMFTEAEFLAAKRAHRSDTRETAAALGVDQGMLWTYHAARNLHRRRAARESRSS